MRIGCHLSSSKGFCHMAEEALSIGANTFQFFTRNPRGGSAKELDENDIARFKTLCAEQGLKHILAHAPYTLNPCSADERIKEFTLNTLSDDISRMERIPGNMYNLHPGSHVGNGAEFGINALAELLIKVLPGARNTYVLLETMSGKGTEIGRSFEELREVIDRVEGHEMVGVCLDTCHVYDAGYDVVGDLDGVLTKFDNVIGLKRLKAVHINDSKNPFSSHKDRHEVIGGGSLGNEAFKRIINHPALSSLPFYLETPNDLDGYTAEIAFLRSLYKQ